MEDRILENHVNKWIKSVEVLDANLGRFEAEEKKAYTTIRGLFSKKRPNLEIITTHGETLKGYLDGGVKDEVYTAVRDFLKTTDIAKDNFQVFKEFLEDKEFFGATSAAGGGAGAGGGEGVAVVRRVEIDGATWEGLFIGDEPVWKGKIFYEDEELTYEGEWDKNGPHGEGTIRDEDNERTYTGRFVNKEQGRGRIEWDNGDWYEGAWDELEPDGQGEWRIGKTIYKGEFTIGACTGEGHIQWSDGSYYDGGWNDKGPHGYGTIVDTDRSESGQYRDGDRIGNGRIEWNDGDWYEGGWNKHGPHGQGTWRLGNRTDTGEYKDGQRVGQGKMEWTTGNWYKGGWDEEGYIGKGTHYDKGAHRYLEAEWKGDNPVGVVSARWENGDTYKGTWTWDSNGKLNGTGEYYSSYNGKTRSGQWVNGTWKNDWATPRNIFAVVLWVIAGLSCLGGFGGIILGLILIWIGRKIYEGK